MRRANFIGYLLAALVFGLQAAPTWAIGTTPPAWKPRETVTGTLASFTQMEGADRSLAYDHHGNPGIAFFDDVSDDLRYARRVPGVGWVHTAIDSTGNQGLFPSLAYDRYERPAISYYNGSQLRYARLNSSGVWIIDTVDGTPNVGDYTSLAFDLLGRPAIAYRDLTNTSLKYIQDTDGDFSLTDETPVTVVNQFDEGRYASLVFDGQNRPMIAHYNNAGDLRFSVQEPSIGWATTTVDSAGVTGEFPSIAIDPDNGFPAIAYADATNSDLRYAAWNGDAWILTTVDATNQVGFYASLAFDPSDGNPAIAYYSATNSDLKLAWHNGSIWQNQIVDAVGNVGLAPSLAFNDYGSGFPSIAYLNSLSGGAGQLYFIDDPPGLAVPEPASAMLLLVGVTLSACWRKRTSW